MRYEVREPDVVVVLDPSLITVANVLSGLKRDGIIVINTGKSIEDIKKEHDIVAKVAIVDANKIAREILGLPITNTTMIGALVRATGIVEMASLIEPLKHRFGRIAEKNIQVCEKAYSETIMEVG